jgi:uncharacterized Zn-finger protein
MVTCNYCSDSLSFVKCFSDTVGGIDSYQVLPTHSASAPFQIPEARQTFVLRMSLGMSKPSSHPNVHIDLK